MRISDQNRRDDTNPRTTVTRSMYRLPRSGLVQGRLCRMRHRRHAFAIRALQTCPDGRDAISRHMVALSTYLGHSNVANTYWYLEAVPDLMRDIAEQAERMTSKGRP